MGITAEKLVLRPHSPLSCFLFPRNSPPLMQPGRDQHILTPSFKGADMGKKKKKVSNVPEGDVRLAVNIDKTLHKRLKLEAVKRETTIGELIEELVKKHL